MKSRYTKMIPILAVLLMFVLLGGPQMALAQSAAQPQEQNAPPAQPQTQQTTDQTGTTQPPAQLPEAPQAQEPVGTPALPQDAQQQQSQQQNKKDETPVGAAAAQKGETAGGAASKPTGTAIAPAKQRQVRSLLLKLGMIAAGGAAIGTVLALTKGTPSVPPGSGR
jgi:outer membrane biosynthesis protein TonB